MSDKVVELKNIWAGYDHIPVVKNVNLTINEDDFIGVIGPNGGGKSTILKVILGVLKPIEGQIIKKDIRIGYLPQINTFDKQFPITVQDVVLSGLMGDSRKMLWPGRGEKEKVKQLLSFAGMKRFQHRPIGELSGGQMQRVFLCRAIIGSPKLLILDEPGTYVDKNFETDLYNLLPELNKEMAIVLVSHDVGTISSVVKTIACVNGGLHYHTSNKISEEILKSYNCPVEIIAHGPIPHRILKNHE
jgi:zinc transport system ATP-binding protein